MTTNLIVSTCKMVSDESDTYGIWICKTASSYHSHDLRNNCSFICLFVCKYLRRAFSFYVRNNALLLIIPYRTFYIISRVTIRHTSIEILVNDICSDQMKMCIIVANEVTAKTSKLLVLSYADLLVFWYTDPYNDGLNIRDKKWQIQTYALVFWMMDRVATQKSRWLKWFGTLYCRAFSCHYANLDFGLEFLGEMMQYRCHVCSNQSVFINRLRGVRMYVCMHLFLCLRTLGSSIIWFIYFTVNIKISKVTVTRIM